MNGQPQRGADAPLRCELSVSDMPDLMADMRLEVANMIREVAAAEDPAVSARLVEVAAAFEAGVTRLRDDGCKE